MSNEKLAEIRKLAVRLQTAAYDHGGIDASDRWSAKKYADADDRSRAALTTLMDKVSEALQAHAAESAQTRDTMTPRELAKRIGRGENWKMVDEPAQAQAQSGECQRNSPAGCDCIDTCVAISQPQAAEPVRQFRVAPKGSVWTDVKDPEIWASVTAHPESYETRVLYTHPQPAQDASNPLKGWIFHKVNMGRGDERYICTPDGANATTVRNASTSDHRERLLWLIADAMAKESGR